MLTFDAALTRLVTPAEATFMETINTTLEDCARRSAFALSARREALCEEFAIAGAFVNELALAVGRVDVRTMPMPDGSCVISVSERIRVI